MIKQPKTGPQGNGEEKDTVQISSCYSYYYCVRFITWKSPKTHDWKIWSDWLPMICLAVTKHSTSVQTLTSLTGTFGTGCIVLWRYFLAAVCVLSPNNLTELRLFCRTVWRQFAASRCANIHPDSALLLQPKVYSLNTDQRGEYLWEYLFYMTYFEAIISSFTVYFSCQKAKFYWPGSHL